MSTVLEVQELEVKSWKPWESEEGPVRDDHGNYKGSATFDKFASEPVDATFKEQPNIGDKKFGSIEEYQTRAGKTRLKFKRADRPQEATGGGKTWQPRDDMAIRAQWAIGQAIILQAQKAANDMQPPENFVEEMAKQLFAMVDRVKNRGNVAGTFNNGEPLPEEP